MRSTFLLALSGLATLSVGKSHIKHHLVNQQPWPQVFAPSNFEFETQAYQYDPVTNKLTRDFELGDLQYVDSEHNQQINAQLKTIYGVRREIFTYIDFTNKYYTISIPKINFCVENALPYDINLQETMKQLHDPKGNMTKYMGVSTLPFADSTYYQFQVTQTNQETG